MSNDQGLEWIHRKKLVKWMKGGQCTHWSLHVLELGLIRRALREYKENHTLNPVAQEVYDHLMLVDGESEIPYIYPNEKNLQKIPAFKQDVVQD